jgi:hypothetical protein
VNKHLYERPFENAKIAAFYQRCEVLGWLRQTIGGQETSPAFAPIQRLFGGEQISEKYHDYEFDVYNERKRSEGGLIRDTGQDSCLTRFFDDKRPFHNVALYVAGLSRLVSDCEYKVAKGTANHKCPFTRFPAATRIYCKSYGRYPPPRGDDLCHCANWPDREQKERGCF